MFRAFFFRRPATLESAATCSLRRGGGLGRGHSPNCGNLSQYPNRPDTSLAACCPLSSSLPRERGRAAVRVNGSARKTGCAGCFLLFRRPEINGYKPKLPFKSPAAVKPTVIRPLPRGGGLGRGHSPNRGNLSQHPNRPNTSLAACCPLSNSLPRERGRAAVGIKGSARKTGCAGCFLLFRRPAINGCKSKLLFKLPVTAKPTVIRSLPRGEGWGEGILPNGGNLSQHLNLPKYKPCGLLPSL